MSNIYNFPSQFVYWEKIEKHNEIKKNILPSILEHSSNLYKSYSEEDIGYCEKFKCRTSYFLRGEDDTFLFDLLSVYDYLNLIVWNSVDNLLSNEKLNIQQFPRTSKISKIWYNVYSPGGHHDMHTHGFHEGFSGIYILDLSEKNTTKFFTPGNKFFEKTLYLDNAEEGTVILFPNNLIHSVGCCLKNRVTISFNINSSF
jgi:hypothetical protein